MFPYVHYLMTVTVSLITISQYSRIDFLKIATQCIREQIVKSSACVLPNNDFIKEWIIIDTSNVSYQPTEEDLIDYIKELSQDQVLPHIIYRKAIRTNIGGWRNQANRLVTGDIVVCIDDDDYYYPTMVSECIKALTSSECLIAGCTKIMMYDCHFDRVYQCIGFTDLVKHHTTNNCMAYKREYISNHTYDESVRNAEEGSFTNNYQEPMIQLESSKTVLQMSHSDNTFDKKFIIYLNYLNDIAARYLYETNLKISNLIKHTGILNAYTAIFNRMKIPQQSEYDICYLCGLSPPLNPNSSSMTSSQQAVKYLSEEWVKQGKRVAVYLTIDEKTLGKTTVNGVDYYNFFRFRFWDKHKSLIMWKLSGYATYMMFHLNANEILVDSHDILYTPDMFIHLTSDSVKKWLFKSEYHLKATEAAMGKAITNSCIIENGIDVDFYRPSENNFRNPFRLCYIGDYSRGLYRILDKLWPLIHKMEPRAELHVYGGLNQSQEALKEFKTLLSQRGVMDHGYQDLETIRLEKHMSSFHLYYTDTSTEIDCVSVRESVVAGCIPIIADINVFRDREGIRLVWLPNIQMYNEKIAKTIKDLIHDQNLQKQLRAAYAEGKYTNWKETTAQINALLS